MHSLIQVVRNPLPATGGRHAESLEHIKLHAPYAMREIDRAVVAEDYVKIVRRLFPGKGSRGPVYPSRRSRSASSHSLRLDPVADEPLERLRDDVAKAPGGISAARGHWVYVAGATLVSVKIAMSVLLDRGETESGVSQELRARFSTDELPDGRFAFFHPDNYTFGDKIYKSRVIAEAMKVRGVRNVGVHQVQTER